MALEGAVQVAPGATCLESERLVDHISGWLETSRVNAPLSIEVEGSPLFARTVWFRIARGGETLAERRFDPGPARCDDLHAAVGLAVALALKASLLDSLSGAHAPASDDSQRAWLFGIDALGGLGVTPGANFGADLRVQRAFSTSVAARLSALATLGPFGAFPHESGGFDAWLLSGRADLCPALASFRHARLSACVGVAAGAIYVMGQDFEPSRHALVPYLALANALELSVDIGRRWSISVAIDVLVPVLRTRFVVREQGGAVVNSSDVATAGALLAIGPAYRF